MYIKQLGFFFSMLLFLTSLTRGEVIYNKDRIKVHIANNQLIVSNKFVERIWTFTSEGMVTSSLKNLLTGKEWININPNVKSDWSYNGLIGNGQVASLVSVNASKEDDEGFTAKHVTVTLDFEYPSVESFIRYVIWIYPETSGIRTQAFIKGNPLRINAEALKNNKNGNQIECIPGSASTLQPVGGYLLKTSGSNLREVDYHVVNLKHGKKYKVGISWLDNPAKSFSRQIRLTSVDRESEQNVVDSTSQLIKNQGGMSGIIVDVPNHILIDNSFRIYASTSNQVKDAVVSEIWIYEKDNETGIGMAGELTRLEQLRKNAPDQYKLKAYFDCSQKKQKETIVMGRADYLPIDASSCRRSYLGYYNDTQNRNFPDLPIFRKEESVGALAEPETNGWSSICVLQEEDQGLIMVKESHKCVNQYGVETGAFELSRQGIINSGTSLLPEEIVPDEFKWFWASWVIPYQGGESDRQLALKKFDRKRFPVNVERDMYSLVCTWGHSLNQRDGRNAATEKEVLKEMDYVKEINADLLLIDDGWQCSLQSKSATPDETSEWKPAPSNYPNAWDNVRKKADRLGLRLGLWGVAQEMPAQDMVWNFNHLQMKQLKLDFANLNTHTMLDNLMDTVRYYMKSVNHKSSISWDLTEISARYGYYWAREYGNVHFMNRKPFEGRVLYIPYLALRDFWLLSHYANLNKYQLVIQHAKASDKKSDAYKHPETYCVATALMGIPEFMAVPRYYQAEDRRRVGELMQVYKKHQRDIFTGYVFPIGNQPDNNSWSGFQSILEDSKDEGFIMIYRELNNTESSYHMPVCFVNPGDKVELCNLLTGKTFQLIVGPDRTMDFYIHSPADFLFLKWKKTGTFLK